MNMLKLILRYLFTTKAEIFETIAELERTLKRMNELYEHSLRERDRLIKAREFQQILTRELRDQVRVQKQMLADRPLSTNPRKL